MVPYVTKTFVETQGYRVSTLIVYRVSRLIMYRAIRYADSTSHRNQTN